MQHVSKYPTMHCSHDNNNKGTGKLQEVVPIIYLKFITHSKKKLCRKRRMKRSRMMMQPAAARPHTLSAPPSEALVASPCCAVNKALFTF